MNHQMRPSAAQDALFVEAVAHDLGISYISDSFDVPAYRRRHKLSPEDAARRVRYAFLRATAKRLEANHIAVGHTADDQAETVLLHLFRGSGLRGLCGIPPVRQPVIRPLIDVHRSEILDYLKTHRIAFREDPSNRQRRYARNRLRLDLLPALQQSYNPRLVDALCTTARLLADDEVALHGMARERFNTARLLAPPDQVHVRTETITPLPPALQRRVLREALSEAMGSLQGITHTHLDAILALLRTTDGTKWLALPGGAVVERRYNVLLIYHEAPPAALYAAQAIVVPGVCKVDALGVTITSDLIPSVKAPASYPTGDMAWLDAEKVGHNLYLRTRHRGDRFQPLGSPYIRKLKAFLIDAKIPRAERDRLPLLVTSAGIAWVAGVRPAEWAKVTPTTQRILRLSMIRHVPQTPSNTVL
jgi:tRNA(Ile)-lysidine synthase